MYTIGETLSRIHIALSLDSRNYNEFFKANEQVHIKDLNRNILINYSSYIFWN